VTSLYASRRGRQNDILPPGAKKKGFFKIEGGILASGARSLVSRGGMGEIFSPSGEEGGEARKRSSLSSPTRKGKKFFSGEVKGGGDKKMLFSISLCVKKEKEDGALLRSHFRK